ncbi:MAG TPA: 4'-phosphopantetheinyl transferase superfamily protein [Thermoanaerobaculia bacterium]|nr:4'-phosphopantetheinyl transferase superfamily protein [Thermoanaerobaculia bacterium]
MTLLELPLSWRGRALVLRDVVLSRDAFTAEELAICDAFQLPKRREEWMRARIAAKELGVAGSHISFSHSGPYAAAAIDSAPVGIDVQVVREIAERVAHFFLADDEEEAMKRCTIEHRLLHFWCAKEAAWKQRQGTIPTLKRIALRLVEEREDGLTFDLAETVQIGDAIVALTR